VLSHFVTAYCKHIIAIILLEIFYFKHYVYGQYVEQIIFIELSEWELLEQQPTFAMYNNTKRYVETLFYSQLQRKIHFEAQ